MSANNSLIVQVRRGTTAQTASYTGPLAELIVDTDQKLISVQDGVTAGGNYLAPLSFAQAAFVAANSTVIGTSAAFNKANLANVLAQNSYNLANTVNTYSYSAYSVANSAQSNTVITQGVDTTQNTWISSNSAFTQSAYSVANSAQSNTVITQGIDTTQNTWISSNSAFTQSAYSQANTANTNAQTAYILANTANAVAQSAYTFANTVNTYSYSANTFLQANDALVLSTSKSYTDTANTGLKSYSDATYFSKQGGTVSGNVIVQNNLTVQGNISLTGNVISYQVSGNTGQFFGYSSNGFNALYAGIPTGYFVDPQIITQFTANYNGYAGVNHQNINSGANSSSDIFLTSDNGTLMDGFLDLGIGSSTYAYPGYTLLGPNDGFLNITGNTSTGGGKLVLSTGYLNDIVFAVNGQNIGNDLMRVSASNNNILIYPNVPSVNIKSGSLVVTGGVGISGNVYASGIYDNGIELGNYANTINAYAYSANTFLQAYDAVIYQYAVSAFTQANSANILAQASYTYANTLASASGYTANSVIFANTTGYLSNTISLSYYTSNNTLVSSNSNVSTSLFVAYGPSNGLVDIAKIALAQSLIV
jgi:hypothetical protein